MAQVSLTQRLKKIRERCLNVPGGIKRVAESMGRVENTLHNWFKGRTNPSVEDIELLAATLNELETQRDQAKREEKLRVNAALA